jgi:ISXO2-like transposase domain
MDEVYIGGKPRKGTTGSGGQDGGQKSKRGRGTKKMPVMGAVERHGRAIAYPVNKADLTMAGINRFVRRHVDIDSAIVMTDEYAGYRGLKGIVDHYAVNHKAHYVMGDTHTNTIEGFWALVKRSWYGQHHHYSTKWAAHYISEVTFKYNNRNNAEVFNGLLRHMVVGETA